MTFKSKLDDPTKKKTTTKWWMPLVGLILALTLAVMAVAIAPSLRSVWWDNASQLQSVNDYVFSLSNVKQCLKGDAECWGTVDLGMAFVIWLLSFAVLMLVFIAMVGGEAPEEKHTKEIMLQAQKRKQAEKRRKKAGRKKRK